MVRPFDNEQIIAGQGSFGIEACEFFLANELTPDIVLSCTSGGGLVAGTSIALNIIFLMQKFIQWNLLLVMTRKYH